MRRPARPPKKEKNATSDFPCISSRRGFGGVTCIYIYNYICTNTNYTIHTIHNPLILNTGGTTNMYTRIYICIYVQTTQTGEHIVRLFFASVASALDDEIAYGAYQAKTFFGSLGLVGRAGGGGGGFEWVSGFGRFLGTQKGTYLQTQRFG